MLHSSSCKSTEVKILDHIIEEIIYHNGYNVEFNALDRSEKLRVLSVAIDDPRFDKYELLCEGDLYIERIVDRVSKGETREQEIGKVILDNLIDTISLKVQELIDEACEVVKNHSHVNDSELYAFEINKAIFG